MATTEHRSEKKTLNVWSHHCRVGSSETKVSDVTRRHIRPEDLPTWKLPKVVEPVKDSWLSQTDYLLLRYLTRPLSHIAPLQGYRNKYNNLISKPYKWRNTSKIIKSICKSLGLIEILLQGPYWAERMVGSVSPDKGLNPNRFPPALRSLIQH